MGSNGRTWTAMLAFFALAILMAALGREPVRESPAFDGREPAVFAAPAAVDAIVLVASC